MAPVNVNFTLKQKERKMVIPGWSYRE